MNREDLICILKNQYMKIYRLYNDLLNVDIYEFNSGIRFKIRRLRNKYFNDLCDIYKIIEKLGGV